MMIRAFIFLYVHIIPVPGRTRENKMLVCGLIWLSLCLIPGTILIILGYLRFRKWKAIAVTPTRMIVDLEPGRVEVKGKMEPVAGGLLYSPISQRPCIQSEIQVQEFQYDQNGNTAQWVTIHTSRVEGIFLIADGSGKAVVDPKGIKMEMFDPVAISQGPFNEMTLRAQEYIRRTGINPMGTFGLWKRKFRIVELIIPVGTNVYVLGDAVDDPFYKRWQNDPIISPFTIKKEKIMVTTFKSERELLLTKKAAWIVPIVFGVLSLLIGTVGMVFFIS